MFIAALFTISWMWKQPRYPSKDEWIKKLWYIYSIEYHKKEHIWVNPNEVDDLKPNIKIEVNQKEKNKYLLMHIYGI